MIFDRRKFELLTRKRFIRVPEPFREAPPWALEEIRKLPRLSFETIRPGKEGLVLEGKGKSTVFLPKVVKKFQDAGIPAVNLEGELVLDSRKAVVMGLPQLLRATLWGSENDDGGLPYWYPEAHRNLIVGLYAAFNIATEDIYEEPLFGNSFPRFVFLVLVEAAAIFPKEQLPQLPLEGERRKKVKLFKVTNWPGKENGVVQEEDLRTIFLESWGMHLPLSQLYWINPANGRIFVKGGDSGKTVWAFIGKKVREYKREKEKEQEETDKWIKEEIASDNQYLATEIAALTLWGLRLGLRPPEEFLDSLKGTDLEFQTS